MNSKFLILAAAAVALLATREARAQSVEINPALAKVIEAAKKEGKVLLRNAPTVMGGPDGARIAQEGI